LLLSSQAGSETLPKRTGEEKLEELGFSMGSATVHDHLDQTMRLIEREGLGAIPRLREDLEYLEEFKKALLVPRDVGPETEARRDELLSAVDDAAHLYRTMVTVGRGVLPEEAVGRATRRYKRSAAKIERFAKTFPFSGRLL
jgi:hypothetical protein